MREVLERVGRAGDVVVGEGPQHEHDGVDLADVAEELVAEALALAGALDQAADVDELHGGRHHVLALAHRGEARRGAWSGTLAMPTFGSVVANGVGRGQRAAARRARCTATTCPRWGGRRTRTAPWASRVRVGPGRRAKRGAPVGWPSMSTMSPAEALDRVVYLLDRDLAEGRRGARPSRKARDLVRELGDDEVVRLHRAGRRSSTCRASASRTGDVIALALDGGIDEHLAELEAETAIDVGEGAELRAALKGDCHSHTDLVRRRRVVTRDGPHGAWRSATSTSCSPTTRPGSPSPTASTASACSQQLDEIDALNEELAPFRILTGMEVDILEDGALDQDVDLLERLDVVVASVHSKLRMPEQEMTRRMVLAVASPHVDILGHCTGPQGRGHRSPAEPVRRRDRVRGVRPLRHGGRDQLPPRAPGPARGAARAGPRLGLQGLDRHRRPRPGPARVAGLRLRQGRPAWASSPSASSTPCPPTTSSPGRASHPTASAMPDASEAAAATTRITWEGEEHELGGVGDEGGAVGRPGPRARPRRWRSRHRRGGPCWWASSQLGAGGPEQVERVVDARREPLAACRARASGRPSPGIVSHITMTPATSRRAVGAQRRVVEAVPVRRPRRARPRTPPTVAARSPGRLSMISLPERARRAVELEVDARRGADRGSRGRSSGPGDVGHHQLGEVEAAPRRAEGGDRGEPGVGPGFRTVAVSCDIERPRRSSSHVDLHRSAGDLARRTCAVIVRSVCVGSSSSRSIARTAMRRDDAALRHDGQLPGIGEIDVV